MLIYDFFSGTGSATIPFERRGHTVIKVEFDDYFEADEKDILRLDANYLIDKYGQPDFIWASPPCTSFSVASIGRHWNHDYTPKSEAAELSLQLIDHTKDLIERLNPRLGWIMENPRGMLRKLRLIYKVENPKKLGTLNQSLGSVFNSLFMSDIFKLD